MKTALLSLLAAPLCLAVVGCKEQPVDGAGGAIVKPLDKKRIVDHEAPSADYTAPIDNKAALDPNTPVEQKVDPRLDANRPIVSPDMVQGRKLREMGRIGGTILAPDMIQGDKLAPKAPASVDEP